MFDLKNVEKLVLVFLIASLLAGLSAVAYKKLHTPSGVRIEAFDTAHEDEIPRRKVDINTAGPESLESLKGLGKVMAARVIEYRDAHGAFSSIEEIKNVKGIGQALFDKIKDDITVGQ